MRFEYQLTINNLEIINMKFSLQMICRLMIVNNVDSQYELKTGCRIETYSFFFRDTAWVPSRNPLLNLLRTTLRCLIRPVPVVFLLLAFSDQLYLRIFAAGYPQAAHLFFWMWNEVLPHLRHRVCVLFLLFPKELVPLVILTSRRLSLVEVNQ